MLMRNVIQLLCAIGLMMMLSPELTGILFASLLPVIALIGYIMGFVKTNTKIQMTAKAAIGNVAEEAIGNYRTVKAFASEQDEIDKFH